MSDKSESLDGESDESCFVFSDAFSFYRFLILYFLYLLSSAKSDSFLLVDFLHFISLDESDLLDGRSDDDVLTPGPLVRALFLFDLTISLVVSVA